jgi:uncharacterized membrane protein YfcA
MPVVDADLLVMSARMASIATPFATVSLSPLHALLLALAGVGAGVINGVAGGGTLISFPTLLALGYPALTANMTSTVGIWPGYLGGTAGFRREISDQSARIRILAIPAIAGAVVGSVLLLVTPSHTFRSLAPWLVLVASVLFGIQPLLARLLADQHERHPTRQLLLYGGTGLAAVYGGYFGAGMGVMLLAVLGLALPDHLVRTSGLRTILSVLVNGIAAAVFIAHGTVAWVAVGILAAGSLVGGFVGSTVARQLPVPILRVAIVLVGLATFGALIA